MQHHIHTLVKQFFRKETLEEVSVDELRQFTEEYPYSAAGQLLFTRKLQQTDAEQYAEQAEKSTLYFYNPVWSRWLLQNHIPQGPLPLERITHETVVPVVTEVVPAPEENGVHQHDNSSYTEPGATVADEPPPFTVTEEEQVTIPPEMVTEQPAEANAGEIPVELNEPVSEQLQEEIPAEVPAVAEPAPTTASVTTPIENNANAEEELSFESYHTIDYFASQGIKLRLEDLPKDKLGKQLKSFTDWLRSMKRLNSVTDKDSLDDITHQAIQQIADHSIAGKEIITEAMADVWAKQGHRDKAAAIYEKLSLLNPAKSSYFADKIERLKAE